MAEYKERLLTDEDEALLQNFPPLVRRLLLLRGMRDEDTARRFLSPQWERDVHDPFLMKGMQKACKRIVSAMNNNETITIWSDYDMDGIPGAVVLFDFFHAIGYTNVLHHTPHRNKDGFGLNTEGIDALKDKGASVIITVDCGIGDVEQVAYANSLGIDVIITDHHIPHDTLPPAHTILNPKQPSCKYPEHMLCGAGVAFKFVQALLAHMRSDDVTHTFSVPREGWEKWLLDMVGMATVADMVPLVGENRAFAHFGLTVLRKTRRPGIHALLKKARARQRHLNEEDIGFTIAPRINAASRMGHASDAFALLTARGEEANTLADNLEHINKERKVVVATMKREIKRRLEKRDALAPVIVIGNPEWKPSLLGLVAGGLADEFARPVFLWGREAGSCIKGSCRSEGGSDVFALMHHARDVFEEYGGHMQAGGFSISEEKVHMLESALVDAHTALLGKEKTSEQWYDAQLSLHDVTWDTYRTLERLAPFGEGNPRPVFMFHAVHIQSIRLFGKGNEHVELTLTQDGCTLRAISFFTTAESYGAHVSEGAHVSVVAHIEASYFGRSPELRLRLIDVLPAA